MFLPINTNDTSITKMKYTIHPDLTMSNIINLAIETRKIITDMYSSCERYMNNIKIQENIKEITKENLL